MPQPITAKPTWYRGVLFRSRLEVAWARLLDAVGVEWDYEPEHFAMRNRGKVWRYNCDFWLPGLGFWLEIKPKYPNQTEQLKAELLAAETRRPVIVVYGPKATRANPTMAWFCRHEDGFIEGPVEDEPLRHWLHDAWRDDGMIVTDLDAWFDQPEGYDMDLAAHNPDAA
jgi:hypothetical protein